MNNLLGFIFCCGGLLIYIILCFGLFIGAKNIVLRFIDLFKKKRKKNE